jgi:putative isomerase
MTEYESLQKSLANGWNTWNTRSVLSHVLLPEGFALNLGLREYYYRHNLREALIRRTGDGEEVVIPGPHAYDGSFSELTLRWVENKLLIQSARLDDDLVILVTPLAQHPQVRRAPLLVVEAGVLWNRSGYLALEDGALVGNFAQRVIRVYGTKTLTPDPHIPALTPYLSMAMDGPVGISTGRPRSVEEIEEIVRKKRQEFLTGFEKYGDLAEVYRAIQTAVAWDTIYEPEKDRVVTPVSRCWNVHWGGYVLFDWDNYFAAYMASAENRELAYANAVEMTREATETGLVPNFATTNGVASRDRSEPPVGGIICRELYRKYRDIWFLEEVFPNLLRWNRWWNEHRCLDGLLCWGSDAYEPVLGSSIEVNLIHDRQGAAFESGLDNLPVYDDVPFDPQSSLMLLQDAGLNGMYVADCEALADMARVLGKAQEERELRDRAAVYRKELARLWDEPTGIYLNRLVQTGEFTHRLSPISFYPLLARAATQAQAERVIREHFYNPDEFWGEWIVPTIARNDPAYADQEYWRGRIWGPMNFLVYLGLRNYDIPQARKDLAEKSVKLMLKEWLEKGHIHENYNSNTGEGCDIHSSDAFYHWGGLLGMIALIETGYMPAPESAL